MDNRIFPNRYGPIVTGAPQIAPQKPAVQPQTEDGKSFQELLRERINSNSNLSFSKHAVARVTQRNIDLSESQMTRLNEGVKLAEQKGLKDPLILIDRTAFIVNVKNNTVITTVGSDDLKGNVFTNIDGTVII